MNIDRNLRTRTSRILMALPIAAVAFSLAACGGPAERPEAGDVADGFLTIMAEAGAEGVYTEAQARCIAEILVDSEIDSDTLENIANGKDIQKTIEEKTLVTEITTAAATECLT